MVLLAQMGPRAKEGACSCQPSWALAVLGQPPCGSGEATVTRTEQAVQPGRGEGGGAVTRTGRGLHAARSSSEEGASFHSHSYTGGRHQLPGPHAVSDLLAPAVATAISTWVSGVAEAQGG